MAQIANDDLYINKILNVDSVTSIDIENSGTANTNIFHTGTSGNIVFFNTNGTNSSYLEISSNGAEFSNQIVIGTLNSGASVVPGTIRLNGSNLEFYSNQWNQITLGTYSIPNGNSIGNIMYWNGTSWQYTNILNVNTISNNVSLTGAIILNTTNGTQSGTIRWNGTNFEGYLGTSWQRLDYSDVDARSSISIGTSSTTYLSYSATNGELNFNSQNVVTSLKKMCTFSAGRTGNSTNVYLDGPAGATNLNGFVVPFSGNIKSISASSNGSESWTAEIRKNSDTSAILTLSMTAVDFNYNATVSVAIFAGDILRMYCNGASVNRPLINIVIQES